ncbi:MAG: M48 family metalloprotease [Deltaproteobacteria bacterium]|nr:M48 family metalloprotease [Deltaproteobacteria bacterium]MBW1953758.1 M48 family metalloprotease [Deltaproteobacteria bacterium]MBW1986920.1 M48 family metalloprotease [Deltaproteobacteria bacterium]MBW2134091.1 M48 family metalloprotease [Deltaproteobacteria bacterium]
MPRSIWGKKLCIGFTVICFITSFSTTPARSFFGDLTIEKEKQLGEEFFLQLQQYFNIIRDPFLNSYLNAVGQKLVQQVGPQPFRYHFSIIKDPSLNAFAVPGGYVFINTGLLLLMDNEDELAGVIAHEITHIHARHMAKRMKKATFTSIASLIGGLAAVLMGGAAAGPLLMGTQAASESVMLKYSRDDEREADTLGFKWMTEAGYNPREMVAIFSKMTRQRWFEGAEIPIYLKTHPEMEARIVRLSYLISTHNMTERTSGTSPAFTYFKLRLRALCNNPNQMLRDLKRRLAKDPGNVPVLYCLGLIYQRLGRRPEAIAAYKAALARDPQNRMIKRDLAILYYENNQTAAAQSQLEELLQRNSQDEVALFYLGRIKQDQHRWDEALALFEKVHGLNPTFSEVYYNLGTIYGEKKQLGQAHYYLGLHSCMAKDLPTALFHFRKALNYMGPRERYYREAKQQVARLEKMRVRVH